MPDRSESDGPRPDSSGSGGPTGQPHWHGRFADGPSDELLAFTVSLGFDRRLATEDLEGSRAHVRMLGAVGLLDEADVTAVLVALDTVAAEIADHSFVFVPSVGIVITGATVYVNPPTLVTEPPHVVTTTSCAPAVPAGVVTVTVVASFAVIVAAAPPIVTDVTPDRFVPLITTPVVPPAVGPQVVPSVVIVDALQMSTSFAVDQPDCTPQESSAFTCTE